MTSQGLTRTLLDKPRMRQSLDPQKQRNYPTIDLLEPTVAFCMDTLHSEHAALRAYKLPVP
jgi:hypothetical protein